MQGSERKTENKSMALVVKGKYLSAIRDYVATLTIDDEIRIKINPEFEALHSAMHRLQGKHLSREAISSVIFRECFAFSNQHHDRSGPLVHPTNSDLLEGLVARLKGCMESFPRKYVVHIDLPSFPSYGAAVFDLAPDIKLMLGQRKRDVKTDIVDAMLKLEGFGAGEFDTYLELNASGYADSSPDSAAASVCISMAKRCAFVLSTFGVVQQTYMPAEQARATLSCDLTGTTQAITIPDSLSRYFGELIPNDDKLVAYDSSSPLTLLGGKSRPAVTDKEKLDALKAALQPAARYFGARDKPDFPSIAAAIDWYQDSKLAENQTFAYIAACIGMEALLGSDSHLDEMSKRLADRYAFLLGKGRLEREALSAEYTKVLQLRGRLVHAKAARLENDDRDLLRRAQRMLLDAIWHELHEMHRSEKQ
jgi:hypothetical protein